MSEREEMRVRGRDDLTRVIIKQARKDGNYNMTQRQAEKVSHERANHVDKRRKD